MKRSILYALLVVFTFSCASDMQETLADNHDAFLDQMAQSDEYHNYYLALRETEAEEAADPLDREMVTAMYQNGIDFRTLPEAEVKHIPGALTYVRTHVRLMQVIQELNARYPDYPKQMASEDLSEVYKRYAAYRGIVPMNYVSLN